MLYILENGPTLDNLKWTLALFSAVLVLQSLLILSFSADRHIYLSALLLFKGASPKWS